MNVSTSENFAPHSGNEKVIDLDHLDDLPLQNPVPVPDVVGGFDILHKQLDPEERSRVVRDFSEVRKPTEIMDLEVGVNPDSESEDHLIEKIDEARKEGDYDKAYELAKKIENDEVLLSVVQGVIASLISDKKFSLAEKFALLIRDTDAYRKELANIIDNNTDANSALSEFSEDLSNNVEANSSAVSADASNPLDDFSDDSATNKIKINRISEKPVGDLELVSDEDFESFVKTGEVSGDVLVLIAERISKAEKISEREMAIYDTFKDKIELLLKNRLGEKTDKDKIETKTNLTDKELADKFLSYQDTDLPPELKAKMIEFNDGSESAKKYTNTLRELINTYSLETIEDLANGIMAKCVDALNDLGIAPSQFTKSKTWAIWDIAKQYYYFTHQDEADPEYAIANPIESNAKQDEIIYRHIGWEVYNQTNKLELVEAVRDVEKKEILTQYLNKAPKTNGTLSSKDLAEIGEILSDELNSSDTTESQLDNASATEEVPEVIPPIPTVETVNNSEKLEKDLEDSRRELVALEAVWRSKNQQSKSWVRRNLLGSLGLDKQTPLVPEPTELEEAKMVYNLAKKNKLRETIGAGNTVSLLQEVEKEKNAFENLKSTYKPKVVKESQLNRDIRTGILGLNPKEEEGTVYEVEQGAIAEKFSSSVKKGVEVWSKLPKPVQLATSTALVTGTSFTFGLAAAAGPLGYAGYRVAKSALVGGVVSQPFGKVVDKIHERKNKASDKESMEEFSEGINLDNFMEKEAERMARDEKMVDKKKRQRFVKAIGKVAVGGITSASMELTGASDILFGPKDIDLPGKGTLNVPNDYGDMDKYLDKLEKTRVTNTETLTSDNQLDSLETQPSVKSSLEGINDTNIELSSKGFIQDMHNLKAQIMAEYGGEVPDSLKPIMDKTPTDLAKAFHFYDADTNASGVGFKGESFGLDESGNIYYQHLDGSKQVMFDAKSGEFHHFDGKMTVTKPITGAEVYPNGKIGDDAYSKLDFGGNKTIAPDPIIKTAGTEVLEGDPIFKTEAVSVLSVEDTTDAEIAKQAMQSSSEAGDTIALGEGKEIKVFNVGEDKIVSYEGMRIGQQVTEEGKNHFVLDDNFQDGPEHAGARSAFTKVFEKNATVDVVGVNPIAEPFEGGKIYITYNIPNDPDSIKVLLNGKEIASGNASVVDSKGVPKIKMHGNLKGGWFLVDNAYERAFKHIDKLIKAGTFNFKN